MIDIDKALLVFEKKDPNEHISTELNTFKSGYYHYK